MRRWIAVVSLLSAVPAFGFEPDSVTSLYDRFAPERLSARIDQWFRDGERLRVGRELDLQDFRGYKINSVLIRARAPRGGYGILVVNGRSVGGWQYINATGYDYPFGLPRPMELGREIEILQIAFSGDVYVKAVGVTVDDPEWRQPRRWPGEDWDWPRDPFGGPRGRFPDGPFLTVGE